MITRYALFKGTAKPGQTEAFRAAVNARLAPLWTQFPGNTDGRIHHHVTSDTKFKA